MTRLYGGRRPRAAYHEAGHCVARLYLAHSFEQAIVRSVDECRAGPLVNSHGQKVNCEGLTMGYETCLPIISPWLIQLFPDTSAGRNATGLQAVLAAEVSMIEALAGIVAEARHRRIGRDAVILAGRDKDLSAASVCAATWFPDTPAAALTLAEDRAVALVQSPHGWRAVQGMAARLLEEGALDGKDAEDIFATAYGQPVPAHGFWADRWPPTLVALRELPA